jgi:hypothetical protein
VTVALPGAAINLDVPASVQRASYAIVNENNAVKYIGLLSQNDGTNPTLRSAAIGRTEGTAKHAYLNKATDAMIILALHGSEAASRGAERFFVDVFRQQGITLDNTRIPMGLTGKNWAATTSDGSMLRRDDHIAAMRAFLKEAQALGAIPAHIDIDQELKYERAAAKMGC